MKRDRLTKVRLQINNDNTPHSYTYLQMIKRN